MKLGSKNNSYLSVCLFAIFKIRKMMAVWFLLIISLVIFATLTLFIFFKSDDLNSVISNFQYGVLIFTNIILLLFILLIIIKIFGREFTDGTYLLLISRPYSRLQIFILKLITIWFLILIFIVINLGFTLILVHIMGIISNKNDFVSAFQELILKLFVFSVFVSYLASSGIIFISTFFSVQTVLLIGFIFCSLFLLGGMPYSLITTIANNLEIKFKNETQKYTISQIKETFLFKEKLDKKEVNYYNLTKKIYDFYNQESLQGLQNIIFDRYEDNVKEKWLKFYEQELGLTKSIDFEITGNNVEQWRGQYKTNEVNELITKNKEKVQNTKIFLKLQMPYFFKTSAELKNSRIEHQELANMVKEYLDSASIKDLMFFNLSRISSLILFDKANTYFKIDNDSYMEKTFDPFLTFKQLYDDKMNSDMGYPNANSNYKVKDSNFYESYEKVFNNPLLYVFKDFEYNIIKKVIDFKIITTNQVDDNHFFFKFYLSASQLYGILSKINIIEHINQIWTSSVRYNLYSFEKFQQGFIDFNNQRNYLMSYDDFPLVKDENGIFVRQENFINTNNLFIFYLTLSSCFLLVAYLILNRKTII